MSFSEMIPRRTKSDVTRQYAGYILAVFGTVVLLAFLCWGGSNSEGYRDGWINKFSHKGVVSQSWEGEMSLVGPNQGADIWKFSVANPEIVKQIQDLKPGQKVRLYYKQSFFYNPIANDTGYQITRIERAE